MYKAKRIVEEIVASGKLIAASVNRTRLRRFEMAAISGITPCATDTRDNIGPQTVKRSTGDRDVFLGDADGWLFSCFSACEAPHEYRGQRS